MPPGRYARCVTQEETSRPYYGWVMAGVCTVALIATGPGQTLIVSQFNNAIREDLGLSVSALSTAYMVGTICAALPLVFVGKASDRFGPRVVMGVVALLFGLACIGIGFVHHVVTLAVAFFFLRFLGQGSLGLVSGHALALWFERRLGTVNGMKLVGTQLGFALMPALAIWLIETRGWRIAYALLGVGVWLCVLPLVAFVSRDRPEQVGQRIDGDRAPLDDVHTEVTRQPDPAFTLGEALSTFAFWVVAGSTVLNGLIGTALLFHMQPLLEEAGLPVDASAAVVRMWSLTVMICVLPCGWLADKLPPRVLLPLSLVLLAVSSGVPQLATRVVDMHLAMVAFGVSQSLAIGVGAPTIARYFGRAHHGSIRGTTMKLGVAGTGLGPVMLGLSWTLFDTAAPGLWVFIGMSLVPAIAGLWLRKPAAPLRGRD